MAFANGGFRKSPDKDENGRLTGAPVGRGSWTVAKTIRRGYFLLAPGVANTETSPWSLGFGFETRCLARGPSSKSHRDRGCCRTFVRLPRQGEVGGWKDGTRKTEPDCVTPRRYAGRSTDSS